MTKLLHTRFLHNTACAQHVFTQTKTHMAGKTWTRHLLGTQHIRQGFNSLRYLRAKRWDGPATPAATSAELPIHLRLSQFTTQIRMFIKNILSIHSKCIANDVFKRFSKCILNVFKTYSKCNQSVLNKHPECSSTCILNASYGHFKCILHDSKCMPRV